MLGDEIHLLGFSLMAEPAELDRLRAVLAADELARANAFVFPRDRDRYIVGRGRLRYILSRYTSLPPEHIRFGYGPQGKPELAAAPSPSKGAPHGAAAGAPTMDFNLAHSADRAIVALGRGRLGVDLEQCRHLPDALAIAQRFFTPREAELLARCAGGQLAEQFFRLWCRKEAIIKALGTGLSQPLNTFEVTAGGDMDRGQVQVDLVSGGRVDLSWQDIAAPPGYVAALAHEGGRRVVRAGESGGGLDTIPPAPILVT
jgi:4'-phosphopantetheinyl transferase